MGDENVESFVQNKTLDDLRVRVKISGKLGKQVKFEVNEKWMHLFHNIDIMAMAIDKENQAEKMSERMREGCLAIIA